MSAPTWTEPTLFDAAAARALLEATSATERASALRGAARRSVEAVAAAAFDRVAELATWTSAGAR